MFIDPTDAPIWSEAPTEQIKVPREELHPDESTQIRSPLKDDWFDPYWGDKVEWLVPDGFRAVAPR